MGLAASPAAAMPGQPLVVDGDPGARPAEDVGGPDDEGIADAPGHLEGVVEGVGEPGLGDGQADVGHGLLELLAVLGGGDGRRRWRRSSRRRSGQTFPARAGPWPG